MFTGSQTSLRTTTEELQLEEYDTFQSFLCESRAVTLTSNPARDPLTPAWASHYTELSREKNICVSSQHETWLFNDSWGQRDPQMFIYTDPCITNTASPQNRAKNGINNQQPSPRSRPDWSYLIQQGQVEVYYPFTSCGILYHMSDFSDNRAEGILQSTVGVSWHKNLKQSLK